MQSFARVVAGVVAERVDVPDGLVPGADLYTREFAATLVACAPSVRPGDLYDAQAAAFSPAPPPPDGPVPDVSSAQAKIQLGRAGHLAAVKAAVDQAGGEVAIWYSDARTWQRQNPYVVAIGKALGLSADDMDALFRAAAAIQA